jgi:hypothetical protein
MSDLAIIRQLCGVGQPFTYDYLLLATFRVWALWVLVRRIV